jgi:outer membrane protein TolC
LRTVEGALATSLGLPAGTRIDIGLLPPELPVEATAANIDSLIGQAMASRPELAASRAEIAQAEARIDETRADYLPTVNVSAGAGRRIALGSSSDSENDWSTALLFRFPFFSGFRNRHEVRAAELQRDIAREQTRSLEQQVNLQVWSSYYALQTAAQRFTTSRDLLDSARQSSEVARARYREGLGSILDLLTAESALASATAQEIGARADWLLAVAQLAHDTGSLTPESISALPATRGPQ